MLNNPLEELYQRYEKEGKIIRLTEDDKKRRDEAIAKINNDLMKSNKDPIYWNL